MYLWIALSCDIQSASLLLGRSLRTILLLLLRGLKVILNNEVSGLAGLYKYLLLVRVRFDKVLEAIRLLDVGF